MSSDRINLDAAPRVYSKLIQFIRLRNVIVDPEPFILQKQVPLAGEPDELLFAVRPVGIPKIRRKFAVIGRLEKLCHALPTPSCQPYHVKHPVRPAEPRVDAGAKLERTVIHTEQYSINIVEQNRFHPGKPYIALRPGFGTIGLFEQHAQEELPCCHLALAAFLADAD